MGNTLYIWKAHIYLFKANRLIIYTPQFNSKFPKFGFNKNIPMQRGITLTVKSDIFFSQLSPYVFKLYNFIEISGVMLLYSNDGFRYSTIFRKYIVLHICLVYNIKHKKRGDCNVQ